MIMPAEPEMVVIRRGFDYDQIYTLQDLDLNQMTFEASLTDIRTRETVKQFNILSDAVASTLRCYLTSAETELLAPGEYFFILYLVSPARIPYILTKIRVD